MFPAALAVAGDVHIVGEVGRATAAARRRYLALQRRGKGEAAMERARARKNGVSARFGGASALRARPWAFAHPSYPLSCVHGDELAPCGPFFGVEEKNDRPREASWAPGAQLACAWRNFGW